MSLAELTVSFIMCIGTILATEDRAMKIDMDPALAEFFYYQRDQRLTNKSTDLIAHM